MPKSIWEMEMKDLVSANLNKVSDSITRTFGKIQALDTRLQSMTSKNVSAISNSNSMIKTMGAAVGGYFAVSQVADWGKQIFQVGADMEQTNIAYQTLLSGNKALAGSTISDLKEFAKVTKFSNKETLDAGQSLLAFGIDAKKLLPTVKTLGDLSLGNSGKFASLADNYGKMVSAQRGNTMDLNQFAIAGIPIWKELEKITGKSGQALRKYVEENGVGIGMIDQAFANLTGPTGNFYKALENQNQTTWAKAGTFMAGIEEMYERIFNKAKPYIDSVFDFGNRILPKVENGLRGILNTGKAVSAWMSDHQGLVYMVAGAVGGLAVAWAGFNLVAGLTSGIMKAVSIAESAYLVVLAMMEGATLSAALAQLGLNAGLLACPITWIVVGIGAAVGAVMYFWNTSEKFRVFLYSLWETVKVVFTAIGKAIWNALSLPFKLIAGVMTGNMAMIKDAFGEALSSGKALLSLPGDASKAWDTGEKKGLAEEEIRKKKKETESSVAVPPGVNSKMPGASANADANATGSAVATGGGGSDSSKGSGVRNVIVNMVNNITLHSTTVKEGSQEMKTHLLRALVDVTHDSELALGSNQ